MLMTGLIPFEFRLPEWARRQGQNPLSLFLPPNLCCVLSLVGFGDLHSVAESSPALLPKLQSHVLPQSFRTTRIRSGLVGSIYMHCYRTADTTIRARNCDSLVSWFVFTPEWQTYSHVQRYAHTGNSDYFRPQFNRYDLWLR